MGRPVDLHPDDTAARLHLVATLRHIRETLGITRAGLAVALDTTVTAVASRELKPSNPAIHTAQAWARALGHQMVMRPMLTPELPTHPVVANLQAMAAGGSDDDLRDSYHRSAVLHTMTAHRRWLGVSAREFMTRLGGSRDSGALSAVEAETKPPHLATYQRYARALGGWLHLDPQPLNQLEGVA